MAGPKNIPENVFSTLNSSVQMCLKYQKDTVYELRIFLFHSRWVAICSGQVQFDHQLKSFRNPRVDTIYFPRFANYLRYRSILCYLIRRRSTWLRICHWATPIIHMVARVPSYPSPSVPQSTAYHPTAVTINNRLNGSGRSLIYSLPSDGGNYK